LLSIQMGNFSSWKRALLVAIAIFTFIALILSGCGKSKESTTLTEEESATPTEESAIPAETETLIDEIVQNLIQDASTEQEAILDEEVEAAVLDAEDVLPRDIGESADER